MLRKKVIAQLLATAFALPLLVFASAPIGKWTTIDDTTGKPKSVITIEDNSGVLKGTITKIFNPAQRDAVCDKCTDDRKGQKIMGMTILRGMKKVGDEYVGGTIVDPQLGKEYSAKIKVIEGGKKLEVRGYIGFSLFGRSQIWERNDD